MTILSKRYRQIYVHQGRIEPPQCVVYSPQALALGNYITPLPPLPYYITPLPPLLHYPYYITPLPPLLHYPYYITPLPPLLHYSLTTLTALLPYHLDCITTLTALLPDQTTLTALPPLLHYSLTTLTALPPLMIWHLNDIHISVISYYEDTAKMVVTKLK